MARAEITQRSTATTEDMARVRERALKRAYSDRQAPIQEDDAWAFGEGVRAGIDAVLGLLATAPSMAITGDVARALDSLPYFTFEDDEVAPDEEFVRKADVARLLATALRG